MPVLWTWKPIRIGASLPEWARAESPVSEAAAATPASAPAPFMALRRDTPVVEPAGPRPLSSLFDLPVIDASLVVPLSLAAVRPRLGPPTGMLKGPECTWNRPVIHHPNPGAESGHNPNPVAKFHFPPHRRAL